MLRLCYRARWSDQEVLGEHWVDYPKSSDPDADALSIVRRADRAELPFFVGGRTQGRALSLAARAMFRALVDGAPGADFTEKLEALLTDLSGAAERLGTSDQVRGALEAVMSNARLPLGAEGTAVGDLLRFVPEGGVAGAVLRSLTATLDLSDEAGFLPSYRHGSTAQALITVCELIAAGGKGVIVMDDFGEDLDAGTARHLAAIARKHAAQSWLTTRRAPVAEAFRPNELVRLAFDNHMQRRAFPGWEPESKAERAVARHFGLQVFPSVTARAMLLVEGPHDRTAYGALTERLFRLELRPLLAARRIALADAGTTDQAGGTSTQPRIAAALRRLGFFVISVTDGDVGDDATAALANLEAASDAVVRLPDRHAIELAILSGLTDGTIRSAAKTLDALLPADIDDLTGEALVKATVGILKSRGGLHAQFLDALDDTEQPDLATRVLDRAVAILTARERGLIQLEP